jgi:hypothetical protein
MTHLLVLQWPASSPADFDELVEMEDALYSRLSDAGSVDGHDFGSGEMNIFIFTERPTEAFAEVQEILGDRPTWASLRAAFREANGETYSLLWPPGQTEFSVK